MNTLSGDDIERLLRQHGAERARFLHTDTLAPQNPDHNLICPTQQQTLSPRNQPEEEEPSDWRNKYKFLEGNGNAEQVRSHLLVVATLLATATYEACLNPPRGVKGEGPSEGISLLSIKDPESFIMFVIFNAAGFTLSSFIISALTTNFPWRFEMYIALTAMAVTYASAMRSLSPPGTKRNSFTATVVSIASVLPTMSVLVRVLCNKLRRNNHSRRRNQDP